MPFRVPPSRRATVIVWAPVALLLALMGLTEVAAAQYFGRNKVQYEEFDWRVLATEHFDILWYPPADSMTVDAAQMSERWNTRLAALMNFKLPQRRTLVYYANHPDFQQTNVISGLVEEGTGGVTEGLRTRVALPYTGIYETTDHVIGHELVHVYQYDIASKGPGGLAAMARLPGWLVEGMAEYLSSGRWDPNTAMWMRDAVLHERLPTIKQLTTDPRFFPYRFGQALWAFIGGVWGDEAVPRLYRASLQYGFERAIQRTLGISQDSLSKLWHAATRDYYRPLMVPRLPPDSVGRLVLGSNDPDDNESSWGPIVSPDGKYVAFYSTRGLFSINLYLADAQTGRVIRKLADPNTDPHWSALSFLYSAGAWSPDGSKLAFVTFEGGDNALAILDISSGEVVQAVRPGESNAIQSPSFSPDGRFIVYSGIYGGRSDLFLYDVQTRDVRQLTNDWYADLDPVFSPDGRTIAWATDRGPQSNKERLTWSPMNLALLDVATGAVRRLPVFDNVRHSDPQFSPDGRSLFFVSDREGFQNVYRLDLASGEIRQVTQISTGVSGHTPFSPAISVAAKSGDLFFSAFSHGDFQIRALPPEQTLGVVVPAGGGLGAGGFLPPMPVQNSIVASYLVDPLTGLVPPTFEIRPYDSDLSLEAIGAPTFGAGVNQFGTAISGGVSVLFGDVLGNRRLGVTVQAQGQLEDIGGQILYLNAENRWNWTAGAAHIPFLTGGFVQRRTDPEQGEPPGGFAEGLLLQRVFIDVLSAGTQYPFSLTRRFELGLEGRRISYDYEITEIIYDQFGQPVGQRERGLKAPDPLTFAQGTAAFVGDWSQFGYTSPIAGGRYRFEAAQMLGDLTMTTALADYRRYFWRQPFTLAFRGLHYGRYGSDAGRLFPLFVGEGTLMRGYTAESFDISECVADDISSCPEFDQLFGSRIAIGNLELRIPLLGPGQLSLINTNFLAMEVAPFVDAGYAWGANSGLFGTGVVGEPQQDAIDREPVISAGLSTRINLLGFAVVELFYAKPFQRENKNWVFGFQLAPGF